MDDREIYWEVERTIDYAFDHKFFLDMYEYLKLKKTKKMDVREFLESSTSKEIMDIINDLEEYIHGGNDNCHKQLREGYGHLGKPEARKIKEYLQRILDDAKRYEREKQPGRRKFSK
tara:strand:- start:54 stop:404 length:351 start_codon:yes stop_codon:yes gene_type:complete